MQHEVFAASDLIVKLDNLSLRCLAELQLGIIFVIKQILLTHFSVYLHLMILEYCSDQSRNQFVGFCLKRFLVHNVG